MDLSAYKEACQVLEKEFQASLTARDVKALREDCEQMGWKNWLAWCRDNYDEILQYVTATPSRRKRKKDWQEPILRRRLSLAGIQHVQRAVRLLSVLSDKLLDESWSNRDMAAHAGDLYIDVVVPKLPRWPFANPDPFPRPKA